MLRTWMSTRGWSALALLVLGSALGLLHARAWDLGRRSPALSFDAAQYALAARELAAHGTLATPFALPIDLVMHPAPPWPLSVVQPGLVVLDAAMERIVPARLPGVDLSAPERREWLPLVIPFACYLALGVLLANVIRTQLESSNPGVKGHALIAFAAGAAFLLDPEAQHLGLGGFTELPFTLALVLALWSLSTGAAVRRPLAWGVLLGAAGALRGNLLSLIAVLVIAAAALAPRGTRWRVSLQVAAGYVLVLLPWWIYKWRAFGTPAWDLSILALWDGAGPWTWFSITHRPEVPDIPLDAATIELLAAKLMRNFASLATAFSTAPSGVASTVLLVALFRRRPKTEPSVTERAMRVTFIVLLLHAAIALAVATVGAGWRRYVFPARVPIEAAGLAAAWVWLARRSRAERTALLLAAALAVGLLAWRLADTREGLAEVRVAAASRGLPSVATLRELATRLDRELPPGEPVMSNLGPTLAWFTLRPVVHLALDPQDVAACRERAGFKRIVLAFRDPSLAWGRWATVVVNPAEAARHPALGMRTVGTWLTPDGYRVISLEATEP